MTFEEQIFSFEEWDGSDRPVQTFFKCTLVIRVGAFRPGAYFEKIIINYDESTISLIQGKEIADFVFTPNFKKVN